MKRFRGTLLDRQGRTRFDRLDIDFEPHAGPGDGGAWSGSFEPPTASGVISGETFRLALEDGRAQGIEIKAVEANGHGEPRVRF